MESEADSLIRWGAGRAAAIAAIPIPLADIGPLIMNEGYMIYKLGALYGYSVGENVLAMLGGVTGGSLAGKVLASFLPGIKIAIAPAVTYAVGKVAQEYFKSKMTMSESELKQRFEKAKKEGEKTNWDEHKVNEEE